jgi:hypothetical protein
MVNLSRPKVGRVTDFSTLNTGFKNPFYKILGAGIAKGLRNQISFRKPQIFLHQNASWYSFCFLLVDINYSSLSFSA